MRKLNNLRSFDPLILRWMHPPILPPSTDPVPYAIPEVIFRVRRTFKNLKCDLETPHKTSNQLRVYRIPIFPNFHNFPTDSFCSIYRLCSRIVTLFLYTSMQCDIQSQAHLQNLEVFPWNSSQSSNQLRVYLIPIFPNFHNFPTHSFCSIYQLFSRSVTMYFCIRQCNIKRSFINLQKKYKNLLILP